MCIAIPGKIIAVEGQRARVDFSGNVVNVNVGLIEPRIGQYVLVHAGCAIEVMEKDKAQELIDLFAELEEAETSWNNQREQKG
jgi:hydrogenase expression/formation protein HypC